MVEVLIVYWSVSLSQVTVSVAETISGVLKEKGVEVDSFPVADAGKARVKDMIACLLVHLQWRLGHRKAL